MDSGILTQKLKDARIRRCHMIFDGFCPDHTDRIHLNEIDQHFEYLHPDSVLCLKAFFHAFHSQTQKDTMDRKYFTVNMLAALEKGKFNLHKLFQDPDILELERRLLFLREKYFYSNDRQDESEISDNSHLLSAKILEYEEYKSELLPKETRYVERELFPKSAASSKIKLSDLSKNENRSSLQQDKLLNFHNSQRENQKKLQMYMKRHFGTDSSQLRLQKSMFESRDNENLEKDPLSVSLIFKDDQTSDSSSRFLNENHRKSFPVMHGNILEQLSMDSRVHHNSKKDVVKESKAKSSPSIKKKAGKDNHKNLLKSPKLDTWSNQTTETLRNTDPDPLLSLSWRTLRRISLETLANLNSLSIGSMKIPNARDTGKSHDLLLSVQELGDHSQKQPSKQNGHLSKKPEVTFPAKSKSSSKANLVLENVKESIETLNLTKTPQFSKTNEKSKLRNDIFGKTKGDKSVLFENQPQQSLYSTRRSSRQTNNQQSLELSSSHLSERPSKKAGGTSQSIIKKIEEKRAIQNKQIGQKGSIPSNSFSKADKTKPAWNSGRKSVEHKRPSSNSVITTPLKKQSSYYMKKGERSGDFSDEKIKNNKENTYNFSFTEREISQSQLY